MSKNRILIVDDDQRNIFALRATLRSKGYDCLTCSSAKEALELLNGNEIVDAVLMDMMMPDMDGYEAIPMIRQLKERRKMPVISVTAQAMAGDREKCLGAGADDYISKPIDVDKLLHMLTHFNIR